MFLGILNTDMDNRALVHLIGYFTLEAADPFHPRRSLSKRSKYE